jgi:hypothetical protein
MILPPKALNPFPSIATFQRLLQAPLGGGIVKTKAK